MKTVICTKYGPPEVLQFKDAEKPSPKDDEILIKVRATSVHIGDTKIRRLAPGISPFIDFFFKGAMRLMMGFRGPRNPILGMELSGDIEAIGENVKKFKVGDAILASTDLKMGAYVEYKCMSENDIIVLKPESLTYEEAAVMSNGAVTALLNLKKAGIRKGQKVLIYGASGSVGSFAVQIAKNYDTEVSAVCSTDNVDLVKSLGVDHVIDYKKEDFTDSDVQYDLIFDAVGKIPKSKRKIALNENGSFMNVLSLSNNFKLKTEDVQSVTDLCSQGKLKVVIDKTYLFDDIVEAHRYVDQGHKKGHIAITVS